MAETAAKRLNQLLIGFNQNEEKYLSFVANESGAPELTIENPVDFNQGAMANLLEYLSQMSQSLLRMLRMNQQDSFWLNYTGEFLLGVARYENESDSVYLNRIRDTIFGIKCTCPAIVNALIPYSAPLLPTCEIGDTLGAFADLSFADVYTAFQNQTIGPEFEYWVFPAIAFTGGAAAFFFRITIYNTLAADIPKVEKIVADMAAAGVEYIVQVQTI